MRPVEDLDLPERDWEGDLSTMLRAQGVTVLGEPEPDYFGMSMVQARFSGHGALVRLYRRPVHGMAWIATREGAAQMLHGVRVTPYRASADRFVYFPCGKDRMEVTVRPGPDPLGSGYSRDLSFDLAGRIIETSCT